ncbi:MAG: YezD family protein [Clostridiales bacterium]|jgi:hypothetical protein|nr:YezD family protein [Clostridiales bacterium]
MELKTQAPGALTPKDVEAVIAGEHFQRVLGYLREVKFGTVTLVIQDGKVVQVDRLEKIRIK